MKLTDLQEAAYTSGNPDTGWTADKVLSKFFNAEQTDEDEIQFSPKDEIVVIDGEDQVTSVSLYKEEGGNSFVAHNDRYSGESWETYPDTYEIRQTRVLYKG